MPVRIGHIVFELTQACNQQCRFCYNYWRDGSTPLPPPDPRRAKRTLRRLHRQAKVGSISFSGGEPMLLRGVHDLALTARFKGSEVHILTNGTLLTEDHIENFKSIGVGAVQIPLLSADPAGVLPLVSSLFSSWTPSRIFSLLQISPLPSLCSFSSFLSGPWKVILGKEPWLSFSETSTCIRL